MSLTMRCNGSADSESARFAKNMVRLIESLVAWEFQPHGALPTRKFSLKAMKDASIIDDHALSAVQVWW
jgi:hypothetical protein